MQWSKSAKRTPTPVSRSLATVDAPPADLYRTNPVAFHLVAELYERPRHLITTDDAVRLTGAKRPAALAALRHLVELQLLEQARPGTYREPKRCVNCRAVLSGRRTLYCSTECTDASEAAAIRKRNAEQRAAEPQRHCVACGQALEHRPRTRHQKYCSRHCEYVTTGQ